MPRTVISAASGGSSHLNPFLPDGWDTAWKAARAAAGSSPAWITVIGDSLSTGQNKSNGQTKNWITLLLNALLASTGQPQYADYFPAYGMSQIGSSPAGYAWSGILNSLTADTGNPFETFTGWHRTYGVAASTVAYHQRFTFPAACASADLVHFDIVGGTWKYSINGGADTTVTNLGNATGAAAVVRKIHLPGPFSAGNTIDIGKQSSTRTLALGGVQCNVGPTGIGIGRLVANFEAFSDFFEPGGSTQYPTNRLTLFSGRSDQAAGVLGANTATTFTAGFPLQGHLHIINLGTNDCYRVVTFTQFQDAVQRMVAAIRRGRPNASILFIIPSYPGPESHDAGVLNPPTAAPTVTPTTGTLVAGNTYTYALAYGSAFGTTPGDTPLGPVTANQTGSTGYILNWASPSVAAFDHISVYRSTNAGAYKQIFTTGPTATTATDSGAADGSATNSTTATNNSPLVNAANWYTFMEYIRDVAQQHNCAYLNLHARWGSTPYAQGFLNVGDMHPLDAGDADIAAFVGSVL